MTNFLKNLYTSHQAIEYRLKNGSFPFNFNPNVPIHENGMNTLANIILLAQKGCGSIPKLSQTQAIKLMNELIDNYGANVNVKDSNWNTLLIFSIAKEQYKIGKFLMEKGLNPLTCNKEGITAFAYARQAYNTDRYLTPFEKMQQKDLLDFLILAQRQAKMHTWDSITEVYAGINGAIVSQTIAVDGKNIKQISVQNSNNTGKQGPTHD